MRLFGGIEAGGTKFVCGIGTGPDDLTTTTFATTTPEATVREAVEFFRDRGVDAVGIASFGPVDLALNSATYGHITSTPKPGWSDFDIVGQVSRALSVPAVFDTDVNAAVFGEAKWGAASGLGDVLYLTVGTGIGGGALVGGRLLRGMLHPEMGHIRVPHDRTIDSFEGSCPYHGNCLEGLACGRAIEQRWGQRAEMLDRDHPAWDLEATYLALGLCNWVCTLSPQRIIVGGGVLRQAGLIDLIRYKLGAILNGYIRTKQLLEQMGDYIVKPGLGERAGVLGAIALAQVYATAR